MSGLVWQKSSFSGTDGTQECLEVALGDDGLVRLRESDVPETIAISEPATWAAFLMGIKTGQSDGTSG